MFVPSFCEFYQILLNCGNWHFRSLSQGVGSGMGGLGLVFLVLVILLLCLFSCRTLL